MLTTAGDGTKLRPLIIASGNQEKNSKIKIKKTRIC